MLDSLEESDNSTISGGFLDLLLVKYLLPPLLVLALLSSAILVCYVVNMLTTVLCSCCCCLSLGLDAWIGLDHLDWMTGLDFLFLDHSLELERTLGFCSDWMNNNGVKLQGKRIALVKLAVPKFTYFLA